MAKNHKGSITVASKRPPIVEVDSAAGAVYIRFSRKKVSKTLLVSASKGTVTVDLDEKGTTVGVELIGIENYNISKLIKIADIQGVSSKMVAATSYVAAPAELVS